MLIVFDLDGTLIDSNIDYSAIKDELFEIVRTIVSSEEFDELKKENQSILHLIEIIKSRSNDHELKEKAWKIVEKYELEGHETAKIRTDVVSTLLALKDRGHKIAILTNNSANLTEKTLKAFNLDKLIDAVETRDSVVNSKPDPEGIKKLIKKFNCTLEETLFVGDSWLDIIAANRAKVKFALIGDSYGDHDEINEKVSISYKLHRISDLLKIKGI